MCNQVLYYIVVLGIFSLQFLAASTLEPTKNTNRTKREPPLIIYRAPPSRYRPRPKTSYGAPPRPSYGPPKPMYGPPKPKYGPPSYNYGAPLTSYTPTSYGPPSNSYGPPSNSYGPPSNTYGPPSNAYGPPSNSYGPPTNTYGPPSNTYGPPANKYGPPSNTYKPPSNSYGPPSNTYGPPSNTYGTPGLDPGQPAAPYSFPTYSPPVYSPPSNNYGPPANNYGPPSLDYGAPAGTPPLKYSPPDTGYQHPNHNYSPQNHFHQHTTYSQPAPSNPFSSFSHNGYDVPSFQNLVPYDHTPQVSYGTPGAVTSYGTPVSHDVSGAFSHKRAQTLDDYNLDDFFASSSNTKNKYIVVGKVNGTVVTSIPHSLNQNSFKINNMLQKHTKKEIASISPLNNDSWDSSNLDDIEDFDGHLESITTMRSIPTVLKQKKQTKLKTKGLPSNKNEQDKQSKQKQVITTSDSFARGVSALTSLGLKQLNVLK